MGGLPQPSDHDRVLTEAAGQPDYRLGIAKHQKMRLGPIAAATFSWQNRAARQRFRQPDPHPVVPAWRHSPGIRIVSGDKNRLPNPVCKQ